MGTMLYARGVFLNRCFDELNLSNPTLVKSVHQEYLDAGADVVETNTFGAHRFKLGPHGLEGQVVKINREGARLAREAAEGRGLVAGSMGPLGKPLEPFGNIPFAEAVAAYTEQAQGLLEGGVDFFLAETMPSLDQARAALEAVRAVCALPVMVSMTFNEEGTTFYGDQPEDVVRTLRTGACPWWAPTAARVRSRCWTRCAAWRRLPAPRASPPCPTPAPRPWWTGATSTSARPSTWPRTRAASWPRA
jgi:homocysteine S-methyltransferase